MYNKTGSPFIFTYSPRYILSANSTKNYVFSHIIMPSIIRLLEIFAVIIMRNYMPQTSKSLFFRANQTAAKSPSIPNPPLHPLLLPEGLAVFLPSSPAV